MKINKYKIGQDASFDIYDYEEDAWTKGYGTILKVCPQENDVEKFSVKVINAYTQSEPETTSVGKTRVYWPDGRVGERENVLTNYRAETVIPEGTILKIYGSDLTPHQWSDLDRWLDNQAWEESTYDHDLRGLFGAILRRICGIIHYHPWSFDPY